MSKVLWVALFAFSSSAHAVGLGGPPAFVGEVIFGKLKPAPTDHPGRRLLQWHKPFNPRSRWGGRLKHPLLTDAPLPTCPPEEPGCSR